MAVGTLLNTVGVSTNAVAITAFETDKDEFYEDEEYLADPDIAGVKAASASIFAKRVDKKAVLDAELFLCSDTHFNDDKSLSIYRSDPYFNLGDLLPDY